MPLFVQDDVKIVFGKIEVNRQWVEHNRDSQLLLDVVPTIAAVPEPATYFMALMGLTVVALVGRRRNSGLA